MQTPWLTIVGVVENTDYSFFGQTACTAAVYLSAAQVPPRVRLFAVATEGDPLALAPAARKALAELDPALPLDNVETLAQFTHEQLIGIIVCRPDARQSMR